MPALMVKVWKVEKEQAVLFKVVSDPETFELLQQAVKDLQSVNVWPYPGVVEETMASRLGRRLIRKLVNNKRLCV
jgi:hypothetical protein